MEKKIGDLYQEIPDVDVLVTTTVLNTKIEEVEKKIPVVSGLVKKTDYDSKISDIEREYFTTSDYNKIAKKILDAKIKEKKLDDESGTPNLIKYSDLSAKLATLGKKQN